MRGAQSTGATNYYRPCPKPIHERRFPGWVAMWQSASCATLWETNADGIDLADTLPLGVPGNPDIIGDRARRPHKLVDMIRQWIMGDWIVMPVIDGWGFTCQMWTSSQMIAEDNKLATRTTYTQYPQDGHDTHYAGHSHAVAGDAHTGCRPSSAWQRGSHLQVAYMCRWTTQQGSARLTGLPCKGIVDETYNTDLHLRAMSNNMLCNTMQTEHIHT